VIFEPDRNSIGYFNSDLSRVAWNCEFIRPCDPTWGRLGLATKIGVQECRSWVGCAYRIVNGVQWHERKHRHHWLRDDDGWGCDDWSRYSNFVYRNRGLLRHTDGLDRTSTIDHWRDYAFKSAIQTSRCCCQSSRVRKRCSSNDSALAATASPIIRADMQPMWSKCCHQHQLLSTMRQRTSCKSHRSRRQFTALMRLYHRTTLIPRKLRAV